MGQATYHNEKRDSFKKKQARKRKALAEGLDEADTAGTSNGDLVVPVSNDRGWLEINPILEGKEKKRHRF
jgi:hypothetical protein